MFIYPIIAKAIFSVTLLFRTHLSFFSYRTAVTYDTESSFGVRYGIMYHTDIHSGDGIARLDRVDTSPSTMIHLLPASFIFPLRILNIEREPYRELHQGLGAAQQRGRAELSDQWRRQSYSSSFPGTG